jgi:hypothetical protein
MVPDIAGKRLELRKEILFALGAAPASCAFE